MKILVYAEHEGREVRKASLAAMEFARSLAATQGASVQWVVVGAELESVAGDAARYAPALTFDRAELTPATADGRAPVLAAALQQLGADLLVAASTSEAKDVVGRAAGLARAAMASDVVAHELVDGQLRLDRPIVAGAAIATVALSGSPQVVTVQASAYSEAAPLDAPAEVAELSLDGVEIPARVEVVKTQAKANRRPDVTEASVVVSGGRAVKNSEDFETLVGGLADALGGAAGSSRALVDAGIAPNELQVGQTGKIVAPDLYVALGISGAVQHLAGMKNSKTVVAVNNDSDAPIFEEADYGLVGDVYEVVPQLIEQLRTGERDDAS